MSDKETNDKKKNGKLKLVVNQNVDDFITDDRSADYAKAEKELREALEELKKHKNEPDPDDIA